MTVTTAGPIRGLMGRWLMRLEAAGNILRISFLGVTAASTLTSALALIGYEKFAAYVLAGGVIGTFVFAYLYVETGIFNRKNREKVDYGNNFARPDMKIDDEIIGSAVFAAFHGRAPDEAEQQEITAAVDQTWQKRRNGVEVE